MIGTTRHVSSASLACQDCDAMLVAGGCVTLFTSILIAGLLEFGGRRHIRYRDLAQAIFGEMLLRLLTMLHGHFGMCWF